MSLEFVDTVKRILNWSLRKTKKQREGKNHCSFCVLTLSLSIKIRLCWPLGIFLTGLSLSHACSRHMRYAMTRKHYAG